MPDSLLIFGFGYSGRAIAKAAVAAGFATSITSRTPASQRPEPGVQTIAFDAADAAIAAATHLISTAAPTEQGDPVLHRYAPAIGASKRLKYIGYLSTTGVYGDHNGGWVDEETAPTPTAPRAMRRLAAEAAWRAFPVPVDIFRLAGIYGPGRSMFDDLREGTARRVVKPGHLFGRIHRDDIARGVLIAMQRAPAAGQTFNFADDEPAASADVVVEAARLLGVAPPEPVPYAAALDKMSPMARSFWSENRRVANRKTKSALNLAWLYPTYREGLAAILAEERSDGLHQE